MTLPAILGGGMRTHFEPDQVARICAMLFSTAAEGLVVVDKKGVIQLRNPRLAELFGYGEGELLGQPIEMLIPEDLRRSHEIHRSAYDKRPVERPMGAGLELLGRRKDGSLFPVEVSLNHFVVDDERYVMALVTDVTRRRRIEKELQRVNAELEARVEARTAELRHAQEELRQALDAEKELNALKSRFVSMASHEFRTPLSTIMSSTDLIARYAQGAPESEKMDRHIQRIRTKVRELTAMLNEFLSLEKLEQGMMRCDPHEIDLVHLCIELIEDLRALAKPGQAIHYDHQGQERLVRLDRQMLSNVLNNLLGNAIKYSPEDKRIDLETAIADGKLTITVKDQGMGIPVEDQHHLFERFFRASNAFTVQGTGLGLNLVRRYLDLMGGTIGFESTPGQGSTFIAELPQNIPPHEDHPVDRG